MGDRKLIGMFPYAHKPKDVLRITDDRMLAIKDRDWKVDTFFNMPAYDNPIGIEIEAESWGGGNEQTLLWRWEEDLSLKKSGIEFISYPLTRTAIDYALAELSLVSMGLSFGHRTSVHVHCNVDHYTYYQLHALAAFYAMLEECFYSLVDQTRSGNTFCYHLVGTEPELRWYTGEEHDCPKTTKYCAFNIAPVKTQCSVEFRHMHGTVDPKTLRRWIQLCAKLVYYCGKLPAKGSLEFAKNAISSGEFETKIIREIWGETTDIFPREVIQNSVRNGELWALALLLGVE